MRIIGGKHRSRRLLSPPQGSETRPIPDRVRESVCNLLRGHFEGAVVVDLFAGTGSFGLEAASRGASRVLLVERDRRVAEVLSRNIAALGEAGTCEVMIGDALGPMVAARARGPLHLVWLDPPYALTQEDEGWRRIRAQAERLAPLLADDGFLLLRTPWPFAAPSAAGPADGQALRLEHAEGPETHVYRHTAVHLYARRRAGATLDGAGPGTEPA